MKRPMKVTLQNGNMVKSIFQLPQDRMFANYWNLKQVVYIRGKLDLSINLSDVFSQILRQDVISHVIEGANPEL